MPVWGGVICRPVIPERGLSGASHLVGSYSRRVALSDHMHRYAGKTLVSEKLGDKYARKCTFLYGKDMPRVPSSAGYFFDFRELETQWVL